MTSFVTPHAAYILIVDLEEHFSKISRRNNVQAEQGRIKYKYVRKLATSTKLPSSLNLYSSLTSPADPRVYVISRIIQQLKSALQFACRTSVNNYNSFYIIIYYPDPVVELA